ncbi:hypothetical protein DOTSEDRAFT_68882 [Dothistroma septosporum NZE10]|uniref:Uncharacterized protein n=1 Tax=Dothistroma septosporum (strain NZE10 / CBS 128990) TaxID=675120 RepID=N1Q5C4_DOTSN|nr:hypothetical protein DOTSEDRAFT_68882 [Dothistroma septosporum NZE10]
MTSLLKKLSIRKSSKPSSPATSPHGIPEATNQYEDYDERYEQQFRQSVQKQENASQRPSLLTVGPGCGTPGNAGRHPSQYGLGDIPVPEEKLERELELDERISGERKNSTGGEGARRR